MATFPQPFPLHAVLNNGISSVLHGGAAGGSGAVLFSAGVLSSIRSDITFANSNGISFGLNGAGVITGSVAPGAGAGTGFTTATTAGTNVVGTLGAGGLSMGIPAYLTTAMASNASSAFAGTGFTTATTAGTNVVGTLGTNGISLRVPAYLTTAALSQDSSKYAGTGFTTATTAGSDLVGTQGTNGLSLGVPKWLTTAGGAGGISFIQFSAGTETTDVTDLSFLDTNGVTWGLNSRTISASVQTNYAGTGFTTATTAGTNIVGTLSNNGLSLGVPAYLTTAGAGTGISAINVSAGTTSSNISAITFSNGSGVSFGFDGSNITASVDSQSTQASSIFLSGNTSLTSSGTLNGTSLILRADGLVSLAVSSNSVVISAPASTIFQYLSNTSNITSNAINTSQSSGFAGTGFTTATTAGSVLVGTQGTNGLSLGVPAWLTTATAAAASVKFSAGTLSSNRTDVTFGDSNGVSFGLDTNGVITASINQVTGAISNVKFSAGTLSSNRTDLTFGDSNGISFGLETNGVLTATVATNYLTTFPRLDQVLDPAADKRFNMGTFNVEFQYAGGGTFSTNATRHGLFAMEFLGNAGSGAHGLHVLQSVGNQVDMHMAHFEAHDTNVLPFHIEGSHSNNMWLNQPINFTTDETAFPIGSVPFIMGTQMSNMVSNLNADYVDGRDGSVLAGTGFTTATTAGANVVGTLGTNGLSMGVPAYLTTAVTATSPPQATLSHWQNFPGRDSTNNIAFSFNSNTSYVFPITINNYLSAGYIRFLGNFGMTSTNFNSTSVTNVTGTTTAFNETVEYDIVFYSLGNNANSHSLQYVTSTSAGLTWSVSASQASSTNANQQTIGQTLSYNLEGVYTSTNTVYNITSAVGLVLTTQWTDYTAQRFLDVPFGNSLSPGNYWVGIGVLTGTSGSKSFRWSGSFFGLQEVTTTWANLGKASSGWDCNLMIGLGFYTNAATGSTSSINIEALSSSIGQPIPIMKIVRQS